MHLFPQGFSSVYSEWGHEGEAKYIFIFHKGLKSSWVCEKEELLQYSGEDQLCVMLLLHRVVGLKATETEQEL